jgi:putative membrane protein
MKNLITIINLCIIIGITTIFTRSDKASKSAEQQNQTMAAAGVRNSIKSDFTTPASPIVDVNEEIASFVMEMTEARLMDLEQAKTAAQRGTTRSLKNYGVDIINDQTAMLKDLKKIARKKNVTMPVLVSDKKTGALEDLRKAHGKAFDKKFIRMMIIDHKRDIMKLEEATRSNDADVQVFATKYLPVIERHLIKIKALKRELR